MFQRGGVFLFLVMAIAPALTQASESGDARLTVGMPVYVGHPDPRTSNPKGWNEGWFENEGLLVDATWPVYDFNRSTKLRAGVTAGGFDNSISRTSFFAGGDLELETHATTEWSFSLGTYAGAITGYDDAVDPAIAPYVGTAYAITPKLELGARGYWLPAHTLAGDLAESDAYVGAVTLSTRF